MKNKQVQIGIIVGIIFAVPFFVTLVVLEAGTFTGDKGICPNHNVGDQTPGLSDQTICERRAERGIPEGEITGSGFTCVDEIYYQTNYRCITLNLGFVEAESGGIALVWVLLAEAYGAVLGGIMGLIVYLSRGKKWGIKKQL